MKQTSKSSHRRVKKTNRSISGSKRRVTAAKDIKISQNYFIEQININNLKNKLFHAKQRSSSKIYPEKGKSLSRDYIPNKDIPSPTKSRQSSRRTAKRNQKRPTNGLAVLDNHRSHLNQFLNSNSRKKSLSHLFGQGDNKLLKSAPQQPQLTRRRFNKNSKSGIFSYKFSQDKKIHKRPLKSTHQSIIKPQNQSEVNQTSTPFDNSMSYLYQSSKIPYKKMNARKSLRSSLMSYQTKKPSNVFATSSNLSRKKASKIQNKKKNNGGVKYISSSTRYQEIQKKLNLKDYGSSNNNSRNNSRNYVSSTKRNRSTHRVRIIFYFYTLTLTFPYYSYSLDIL